MQNNHSNQVGRQFQNLPPYSFNKHLPTVLATLATNFSIPPPRVPLPPSQSDLIPVASTSAEPSATTSRPAPPLSYVQRMLNAPVVSGSGRKRPAESTASDSAAPVKRPAH